MGQWFDLIQNCLNEFYQVAFLIMVFTKFILLTTERWGKSEGKLLQWRWRKFPPTG